MSDIVSRLQDMIRRSQIVSHRDHRQAKEGTPRVNQKSDVDRHLEIPCLTRITTLCIIQHAECLLVDGKRRVH